MSWMGSVLILVLVALVGSALVTWKRYRGPPRR